MKIKVISTILALVFLISLFIAGTFLSMHTPQSSKITAPFGTWESKVTPDLVAKGSTSILNLHMDGNDTYWCELRPLNKGRYTIVRRDVEGRLSDVTPPDFNARTFVHEYGGGAFAVNDGIVYVSNGTDSAIYKFISGNSPIKLTEGTTKSSVSGKERLIGTRFADMRITPKGIIAVGEEHTPDQPVENFLAIINPETGKHRKIAVGHDFFSSPAVNSTATKLAWITWDFPEMPWSNSKLWIADISNDGSLTNVKKLAGDRPEAIFQPQWSPDDTLYFVTDRERGWWNLHRYSNGTIQNVCKIEAETAEPLWVFDRSTYAFLGNDIIFTYNKEGFWHLARLNTESLIWNEIPRPAVAMKQLRSNGTVVRYIEGYLDKDDAIVELTKDASSAKILFDSQQILDKNDISLPQHISYPSGSRTAYAYYYPPANARYNGPDNSAPPLVVMIHGGPTSQARNTFQPKMQFWTNRGFAVIDINYGGSTGYGRDYRFLLNNNWGIVDVEDCINGADYLANQGKVDPTMLAIRGGSAGGFTTLAALASSDVFKAGASYYGVADITALAHDTHKFEAKYMDLLVGRYPEEKSKWEERSPITHVNKIHSPLIIFQGENDLVVPKNQSVMIYDALKARNIPVEIHIYPGEEHGFRQAENVIDSLTKEWQFYLKVFGLAHSSQRVK